MTTRTCNPDSFTDTSMHRLLDNALTAGDDTAERNALIAIIVSVHPTYAPLSDQIVTSTDGTERADALVAGLSLPSLRALHAEIHPDQF
jgi:hypothetical protein